MSILEELTKQEEFTKRRIRTMESRLHSESSAGWLSPGDTWTYASASSFTIADHDGETDFSAKYQVGDFIRLKQGGGFLYFMISAVAYADPTTTITVNKDITGGGSDLANATITDNYYRKAWSPQGCGPAWVFTPGYYTSTSWDSDAKAFDSSAIIDLSVVFGMPAGVKAVSVNAYAVDETVDVQWGFFQSSGDINKGVWQAVQVANQYIGVAGIVPCDGNGDIYFWHNGELDGIYLFVTGYWS